MDAIHLFDDLFFFAVADPNLLTVIFVWLKADLCSVYMDQDQDDKDQD